MQSPSIQLLSLLPDSLIVVDDQGFIVWCNENITRLLGYQPAELCGKHVEYLLPKRFEHKHVKLRNSFIRHPSKRSLNDSSGLWALHKEGREVPVCIELNHFEEMSNKYVVCAIRILSEKEQVVSAIQKLHDRMEFSQSLAHVGTWDWDIANGALVWTDETYRIFGLKPQEFEATYDAFLARIHEDDRQLVIDAVNDAISDDSPYDIKHRVVTPTGDIKQVLEKGHVTRNENGEPTRMIGAVLDITQLTQHEKRLENLAHYDEVTQLPNRVLCRQQVEQKIAYAEKNNCKFSIVYFDLDNFKNINDTQGHLLGDEFLFEMAQRLTDYLPEGTSLSRFGGDEFIILTECLADSKKLERSVEDFVKDLLAFISYKKTYHNFTVKITASIGVSIYPDHGDTFTSLLSSADKAMYEVKNKKKNGYEFYHPRIDQKTLNNLLLISDMRAGLLEGQFYVHYQAKQSLKTGKLEGCEALIRWEHPTKGNIPPDNFIEAAENCGFIIRLGEFVLQQACLFVKEWQQETGQALTVSVNVSGQQLKVGTFKETLQKAVQQAGISGNSIELELTESILMDNIEEAIQILHSIKKTGVSVSIDDFGTGYSSLKYLHKFPIDTLKIDKSFVDAIADSEESVWIAQNIISLALGLNFKTVAEGVETERQKSVLSMLGCSSIQGYLYSRPISKGDFFQKFKPSDMLSLS